MKLFVVFSILILLFCIVNGTSAPSEKKQRVEYFPPVYFNWTVLNLDPTLTNEQVQDALDACNVSVDLVTSDMPYHIESWYDGQNIINSPSYIDIPIGNENYTVTLISRVYPGLWNRGSMNNIGYNDGNHALVMHSPWDNDIDIGIRILHEIEHGEGVDPDQMFNNDTANFSRWMDSVGYPYTDIFMNTWKYRGTLMNYRNSGGQETVLYYHQWLATQRTAT